MTPYPLSGSARRTKSLLAMAVCWFVSLTFAAAITAKEQPPDVTHDGLKLLPESKVALAYVKPDADFSAYNKIALLDCYVAFKKNWQRDQNRSRRGVSQRITDKDMERIKVDVAELLKDVFVEELDEKGGYHVVKEAAEDVLLIRPAIIDLDVTAPDKSTAARTRTFTSSAGEATLYIELYDSVSGEILARAVDRQASRDYGFFEWTSHVSNSAEARTIMRRWARLLRQRMDEVHGLN